LLIIGNSLPREWILRLSENFKAKSSTRWELKLVAHFELRPLKDSLFFLDEMILFIDDGLFGTEEVIKINSGLRYLNLVLLMLLSIVICIIITGVSGFNLLLQERLKVDLVHSSQNRMIFMGYFSI
jgi:hypothetical protein